MEGRGEVKPIDIHEFRELVDRIVDPKTQILVKTLYLLAARVNEVLTRCSKSAVLAGQTKPLGALLDYDFQDYRLRGEGKVKALIVTSGVLKRKIEVGRKQEEEAAALEEAKPEDVEQALTRLRQVKLLEAYRRGEVKIDPVLVAHLLGRIRMKVVALPCDPKYDPWALDLVKRITKRKNLSFDMSRQRAWQRITEEFRRANYQGRLSPHVLRHWRISHLIEYYDFDPYEVSIYSGWTMAGTFAQMGIQASSNIDIYAHLPWRKYFKKLLVPLSEL